MTNRSLSHRLGFRNRLPCRSLRRRGRVAALEALEPRRLLAAEWRNPLVSLDVTRDGLVTPQDVLIGINQLNANRGGPLTQPRSAGEPYYDVDGDGALTPADVLAAINAINQGFELPLRFQEGAAFARERIVTIGTQQEAGSRRYRFQVDASFDAADGQPVLRDTLAVYLTAEGDRGQTLLDRGTPGTALFTLGEDGHEAAPGLVEFDGSIVTFDLTDVTSASADLVFQLLSADADTGTRIIVTPLANEVDPEGTAWPRLDADSGPQPDATPIRAEDYAAAPAGVVGVENVRFAPAGSLLEAELHVQNAGDTAFEDRLVISFPGLPAGASVRNAAGLDGAGVPYVNLRGAVPGGNLPPGSRTTPVTVEIENPGNVALQLAPVVLVGPANRAPVIDPLGPLSVLPGGTLEISVAVSDPDGDAVDVRLAAADSLPAGTRFDANGPSLRFQPGPNGVGHYAFTLIAGDGITETRREVTLDVVADPLTSTRLSGRVLDVSGAPLGGMQVEVGAVQRLTLADGSFTLDLGAGPVVSDTLKVRGETYPGPAVYPFIAEKLPLLLERDLLAGVNNFVTRPIYLPPLDVTGGTVIDPLSDTTVRQEVAPGVFTEVFVAAGTLMNQLGTPFTGTLSITEVPVALTPAALPPTLFPDLVVTIQPGEMVFATPAPMTFPNRSGWASGTIMDLWSINPVTGQFDDVGDMRVSADGQLIETVSGGVRNSSWHFVGPQPNNAINTRQDPANQDKKCKDCPPATVKKNEGGSSEVELHSGAYLEDHSLVTYNSLSEIRGVRLVYDSERADPRPIVTSGYDGFPGAQGPFRIVGRLTIQRDGTEIVVPGHRGGEFGLTGGEHFWSVPETAGDIRVSLQADLRSMPTGVYEYDFETGIRRFNGEAFVGTSTIETGDFVHVNTQASPYGSGWGIAGLLQLVENADGSILVVDGDGSEVLFERTATGYDSPPGDFSTLVKNGDGTFTQTFPDQRVLAFDDAGRLVSDTDRHGNEIRWEYDGAGRLVRWIDPVGLVTTLAYDAPGKLLSITDPAGRATLFEHDAAGNLTKITDPDGSARTFVYDAGHHLTAEIDKRGNRESTSYNAAGRVVQLTRLDGGVTRIQPVQTQSLRSARETSQLGFRVANGQVIDAKAAPTRMLNLGRPAGREEANYVDPRGNVHQEFLDQAGQPASGQDQVGTLERVVRYDENLITQDFDARGNRTDYTYDARGNLLTVEDAVAATARQATIPGLFQSINYPLPLNGSVYRAAVGMGDFNDDGYDDVVASVGNRGTFVTPSPQVSIFLSDGRGGLGARVDLDVPTNQPHAELDVADFDGDGHADVVVVGNPVSVLFGNGDGSFRVVALGDPGGNYGPRLTAADLDNDGDTDILVAAAGSGPGGLLVSQMAGYFNNGDGTFVRQNITSIYGVPSVLAVGDLTGDGRPDIAFLLQTDRTRLAVLRANADSSYTRIVDELISSSFPSNTIAMLDVTGDGRLDLVGTRLYRNNGDETFTDVGFSLGGEHLETRDLDGDGRLDVVRLYREGDDDPTAITFFRNLGNGNFQQIANRRLGPVVTDLALGDVNGDGRLDVAAHNISYGDVWRFGTEVSLLVNQGDFVFPGGQISQPHDTLALGDFDEDGTPDLLTVTPGAPMALQLGTGAGSFGPAKSFGTNAEGSFYTMHVADLDGDGHQDPVFGRSTSYTNNQSVIAIFGNGDGTFSEQVDIGSFYQPFDFHTFDIDHDGDVDIFAKGSGGYATFRNDGHRQFTTVGYVALTNGHPAQVADLDGDGNVDLAIPFIDVTPTVRLFRGNGDGTFAFVQDFGVPSVQANILLHDVTGDGRADLIIEYRTDPTHTIQVYPGNDTIGFDRTAAYGAGTNRGFDVMVPTDVDLDGHVDLLGLNAASHHVDVLLNDGAGRLATTAYVQVLSQAPYGVRLALRVADLDSDGDPDFVTAAGANGEVSIRLNSTISAGCGDGPCRKEYTYDPQFSQLTSITDELGHRTLFEVDPVTGNTTRETRIVGQLDSVQNSETDDVVTQRTFNARGQVLTETDPLDRVRAFEYDAFGRLTRVTHARGTPEEASEQYEYDAAGNVTSLVDELGRRTEFDYDALNRVTAVRDALGQETQFTYDANGNPTSITDRRDNPTTSTYDALDRMVTTVDALGGLTAYTYDQLGNVTSVTDELGRTTRYTYDARNRRVDTIDPDGGKTTNRYDLDGNLVRVTDPLGHAIGFSYDPRSRMIRVTDAIGNAWSNVYDPADRLLQTIDPLKRRTNFQYDDLDRRVRTTDPLGGVYTTEFDKASNVVATTDEIGRTWRREYDARDRLVAVTDPLAGVRRFVLDDVGNLVGETDELGRTTTTAYDALDRVTSVTDPAGNATEFAYDSNGNVTTVTDRRGFDTRYEYDALNRQLRRIDALDGVATTEFDPVGQVVGFTDEIGRETAFQYDGRGNLVRVTDPRGNATTFTYDAKSNQIRHTDALGQATQVEYDPRDLPVRVIDALGQVSSVQYDALGSVIATTDRRGNTTRTEFDALDRPVKSIDAVGAFERYEYDAASQLVGIRDRLGRETRFEYDDLGRRTSRTDPLGGVTRATYDAVGNVLTSSDELNRVTTFTYNVLDRVLTQTDPVGNVTTFAYDAEEHVITATDPRGHVTRTRYDALDRFDQLTDALGSTITYTFDAAGQRLTRTDELGRTTRLEYDGHGNLTRLDDPLDHVTTYQYDALNRLVATADPLGHATAYEYDPLDRLVRQTDPRGAIVQYGYDPNGNRTSLTDPVGNVTTFAYDALNRITGDTNQLGLARTYAYDAVGNLLSRVDRNGRRIDYTYDDLNRPTAENWFATAADGTSLRTIAMTYDAVSRMTGVSDPSATYALAYDANGDLTSIDNAGTPGVPNVVFTYAYDATRNRTRRNESIGGESGAVNDYTYDALSRLTRITVGQAATLPVNGKRIDLAYDAAGQYARIDRYSDSAGTSLVASSQFTLDAAGRLIELLYDRGGATINDYANVWDAATRLTRVTSSDGVSTFSYDDANQLIAADFSFQPDESFSFDLTGNRTIAGYQTTANNRLQTDGRSTFEYDHEGNLIRATDLATGNVMAYTFDHRNRLTRAVETDSAGAVLMSAEYQYDPFNRRVAKLVDPDGDGPAAVNASHFVYDGPHIALEFNAAGDLVRRVLHGDLIDQIFAEDLISTGQTLWSLTDHLGTIRDVVDDAGAVLNHLTYNAFGEITSETNAAVDHFFSFTGREFDSETGNYYYRARYYDPRTGRFLSEDPIGFASGDENLYRYVFNEPSNYADPLGYGVGFLDKVKDTYVVKPAETIWNAIKTVGEIASGLYQTGANAGYDAYQGTKAALTGTEFNPATPSLREIKERVRHGESLVEATSETAVDNLLQSAEAIAADIEQVLEGVAEYDPEKLGTSGTRVAVLLTLAAERLAKHGKGPDSPPPNQPRRTPCPPRLDARQRQNIQEIEGVVQKLENEKGGFHRHLDDVRRENAGEVVSRKSHGDPHSHVQEIIQAKNALQKRVDRLKESLKSKSLDPDSRAFVEAQIAKANTIINQMNTALNSKSGK
jgi:RHS repeat-associated protein